VIIRFLLLAIASSGILCAFVTRTSATLAFGDHFIVVEQMYFMSVLSFPMVNLMRCELFRWGVPLESCVVLVMRLSSSVVGGPFEVTEVGSPLVMKTDENVEKAEAYTKELEDVSELRLNYFCYK